MSVRTVLTYDFAYIRRTKALWVGGFVLTLLGGLMAYVFDREPRVSWSDALAVNEVFVQIVQILSVVVPIVALVGTYMAIMGDRDTGRIKFLLSLPNSRRAVFIGKLASRSVAIAACLAVTFVAITSIITLKHGVFPGDVFVGVFALTILFGQTFVSVAISVSAAASSRGKSVAGVTTAYLVLIVFYVFPVIDVRDVVRWIHNDVLGLAANQQLYDFVFYLSPLTAYHKAMNLVVPVELESRPFIHQAVQAPGERAALAEELPWFLGDAFGVVISLGWVLVPLVVSYIVFSRAEIQS